MSHDLRTDLPADAPPVLVGADAVLLFDGVFLLRSELNKYWDLRILVDADAATAISRACVRDAGATMPAELLRKYEVRYEPAWQIYMSTEGPEAKADVIVDNQDIIRPKILKPPYASHIPSLFDS